MKVTVRSILGTGLKGNTDAVIDTTIDNGRWGELPRWWRDDFVGE